MQLAAGIVDEASYWVEPVEKIRERAAIGPTWWARTVSGCRCCGFGRHPARSIPVLREKVANMVEAVSSL